MLGPMIDYPAKRFLMQGRKEGREDIIRSMLKKGMTPEEIADLCDCPIDEILSVEEGLTVTT